MPKENNLVVATTSQSNVTRLEGTSLEAGQFWRVREKIPPRFEEWERERRAWPSEKEKTGKDYITDRVKRQVRNALDAGTVLLVQSLKTVDGDLHAVDMAPHPSEDRGKVRRFLAAEFFRFFEPAHDWAAVRDREMTAVNEDIRALQTEMIDGPPGAPALPVPVGNTDVGSLVTLAHDADTLAEQAQGQMALAQKRATWIKERMDAVSNKAKTLARFHNERATAAMASVETTIQRVKRLQTGIRSLGLYTGEGIEITTLVEGESAPMEEPLTIYQRRLFLDEELAVHLDDGGLDARDMKDLSDFFRNEPALVDRISPAPRSVVLMRLRRHNAPMRANNIRDALLEIMRGEADKQSFLFVRNGENLYLVHSDHIWSYEGAKDDFDANGLVRLFPSSIDMDKPFRGVDGREITLESLDYSDARQRFDDRALAYKRMLILLWGLNDRLRLFGEFYDQVEFDTWTDPAFQARHFRFVADDDRVLEYERKKLYEWVAEANAVLQPGSRVTCWWPRLINEDVAPQCFSEADMREAEAQGRAPHPAWRALERISTTVARRRKGETTVSVTVKHHWRDRTRNTNIPLERFSQGGIGYLCLDGLHSNDLDPYIEERRYREQYLEYLELFMAARRQLRADEAVQAPVVAELVSAAVNANLGTAQSVKPRACEVIRLWRAAHAGALAKPRAEQPRAFKVMLDNLFVLLGKGTDLRSAGEAAAQALGRTPIRLSLTGNGRLILYATPLPAERIDILGEHRWAARLVLDRSTSPFQPDSGPQFVALPAAVASELTLATYEGAEDWIDPIIPANTDYARLAAVIAEIDESSARLRAMVEGDDNCERFRRARERVDKASTRFVKRVRDVVPIGIVRAWHRNRNNVFVLCAEDDAMLIYARSGDTGAKAVRSWIAQVYRDPRRPLTQLDSDLKDPTLRLSMVPLRKWQPGVVEGERNVSLRSVWHRDAVWVNGQLKPSRTEDWRNSVHKVSETPRVHVPETGEWETRKQTLEDVLVFMLNEAADMLDEVRERWNKRPSSKRYIQ